MTIGDAEPNRGKVEKRREREIVKDQEKGEISHTAGVTAQRRERNVNNHEQQKSSERKK